MSHLFPSDTPATDRRRTRTDFFVGVFVLRSASSFSIRHPTTTERPTLRPRTRVGFGDQFFNLLSAAPRVALGDAVLVFIISLPRLRLVDEAADLASRGRRSETGEIARTISAPTTTSDSNGFLRIVAPNSPSTETLNSCLKKR